MLAASLAHPRVDRARRLDRCPLCGDSHIQLRFETKDLEHHITDEIYEFWRCRGCFSYFQNPLPASHELGALYPKSETYGAYAAPVVPALSPGAAWLLAQASSSPLARALAAFQGLDNRIIDLLLAGVRGTRGRVLDVGCGSGNFTLTLVRDLALEPHQVLGIDICEGVEWLGQRIGLRFACTRLEDLREKDFDLISMSHVLEHEPNPRGYIEAAHERLRPGGILFLSVPNARSIPARAMGKRWICHSIPRHLFNFSREGVLVLTRGLFVLESYSAGDIYTFMLSRYYHPALARGAALLGLPIAALRMVLYALDRGDNQSFVFRKSRVPLER